MTQAHRPAQAGVEAAKVQVRVQAGVKHSTSAGIHTGVGPTRATNNTVQRGEHHTGAVM